MLAANSDCVNLLYHQGHGWDGVGVTLLQITSASSTQAVSFLRLLTQAPALTQIPRTC